MHFIQNSIIEETHYEVLSVKEDASYDEIRASYRSAILSFHPDKLHVSQTSRPNQDSEDRFLKVQKAWEVLSSSKLRAAYDSQLRASKVDLLVAEDINLEDMMIEDLGKALELYYQCRCGDYFYIDSEEFGNMGYQLLGDGNKVSVKISSALLESIVLPCGSCSTKVRLVLNSNASV